MPLWRRSRWPIASGLAALLLTLLPPAAAHETQSVKQYRLTLGWGDEPAYSGYKNSVDVDVADGAGSPVTDLGGGSLPWRCPSAMSGIVLPLLPAGQRPGPVPRRARAHARGHLLVPCHRAPSRARRSMCAPPAPTRPSTA